MRKPTTATVYRQIRDMIVRRELPMGAKINQAAMAERLGASRTPVITALHKLESEGLVDNIHNSGFYVHRLTIKELADLFAFREALNTIMVNDLIDTMTDERLDELEALFAPFQGSAEINRQEYALADIAFHSKMLAWCDNDLAKEANEKLQILNRSWSAGLVRSPQQTIREHLEIIAAFRRRDGETARRLMREHILSTLELLQATLDNLRSLGLDPRTIPLDEVELSESGRPA